jgi:hypothetical protein
VLRRGRLPANEMGREKKYLFYSLVPASTLNILVGILILGFWIKEILDFLFMTACVRQNNMKKYGSRT